MDNTLPSRCYVITMILRVCRIFFEITTFPNILALLEAELHDIVELVLGGRDEHESSPHALTCECTIEVHDPTIRCFASRREGEVLAYFSVGNISPFYHEVGKGLTLADYGGPKLQLERL